MICPNCRHNNRAGAKFCEECGIVLPSSSAGSASPLSAPVAPTPQPRAPSVAPRRAEPYRTVPPSASSDQPRPSGTTMLPPADSGNARRMFTFIALGLIVVLCICCSLAALTLYLISQNQSSFPLIGLS
jgi:zinc ribbon protein